MAHDPAGPASVRPPLPSQEVPSEQLCGALHEVSNALTVVVGWLDRALAAPLDPELHRALSLAHARALDGRAIARRAIGALPEEPVQQGLAALLDEAVLGVLPPAAAADVRISLRPVVAGSVLLDDARVVLQILTNLLLNAVAFSSPGQQVEIAARAEAGEVELLVIDDGPGVPPERRAVLFQRGSSTRRGGAGIGLAHSHEIALAHGGDLALLDTSRGATFRLRWPCAPSRSAASLAPRPSVALQGRRLLLIEDDTALVELLDVALSARGAEVISVSDAASLPSALLRAPFDVVLIDWSPIAADATALLDSVRLACPSAPFIAISGSAVLPDHQALAGYAAWVRKPFDLSELLAVLSSVFLVDSKRSVSRVRPR